VAAAKNNGLDIAALCDVDENAIKARYAELCGHARVYTDYREMLAKEEIRLAAIATESGAHAQIALDCIASGVNIIIEKPIALSLSDADQIIKAAEEAGVVVCACHQNRFNKAIQKIRGAVEAGRFGRLLHGTAHVRWHRDRAYYAQAPWRGTWAQDGGALMNQCIHSIDLLRWMMGDAIEEVTAYTDRLLHDYIEAEDLGVALVKFQNGGYGIIEGTTNVFPKNLEETLYLFGEKGTVKAGGRSVNRIDEWLFGDGADDETRIKAQYSEDPPGVYGFGHTPLYADVIDAIQTGRPPYVDARAGRRALELVLAVYKAAAAGRPVKLPLEACDTLQFKGRF
jgi:predicted dehydrogenase